MVTPGYLQYTLLLLLLLLQRRQNLFSMFPSKQLNSPLVFLIIFKSHLMNTFGPNGGVKLMTIQIIYSITSLLKKKDCVCIAVYQTLSEGHTWRCCSVLLELIGRRRRRKRRRRRLPGQAWGKRQTLLHPMPNKYCSTMLSFASSWSFTRFVQMLYENEI